MEQEQEDLVAQMMSAREDADTASDLGRALSNRVAELVRECDAEASRADTAEKDLTTAREQIGSLTTSLGNAQMARTEAEAMVSGLKAEMATLVHSGRTAADAERVAVEMVRVTITL
jgi:chromosome segregation ATPase